MKLPALFPRFVILIAIAIFGLLPSARAGFVDLHDFDAAKIDNVLGLNTNLNGSIPYCTLALSGNTLYGVTVAGGVTGSGTLFSIHTDGSSYSNLYTFTVTSYNGSQYTNTDGFAPGLGLVLSGGTLYGTTTGGGFGGFGTLFAISTNGTGFTNLYNFLQYSTGIYPYSGLILSGSTLYGTTEEGGSGGGGTVFAIKTDGTGYTNLCSFDGGNSGEYPYGSLALSGGVLYGTTTAGALGGGTVFRVNTDGSGFTNLMKFYGSVGSAPWGGLVISGNTLYGTTEAGGTNNPGRGTVFSINTDGSNFMSLHSFIFSDGAEPYDSLVLSGGVLYGTTYTGGSTGEGTVFSINTDGSGFTNLYTFTQGIFDSSLNTYTNSDGSAPKTGLVLSGNTLYGATTGGGVLGTGTVFSLGVPAAITPVPLMIQSSGNQVILSWTGAPFSLYASPTVNGTFTNIPGAVSPYTNPITGPAEFFELQAN